MTDSTDVTTRYVVDYGDVTASIGTILELSRQLTVDSFVKVLLKPTDLAAIEEWRTTLAGHRDGDFLLLVMGDFKRGKSTLINALLSTDVLPVDVAPETVTINQVAYGQEETADLLLTNGKRVRLREGELKRDKLLALEASLPAPIDRVEVRVPAELLRDLRLVDTPGLGDLLSQFEGRVTEDLKRADAVVYVTSVLSPLSDSEEQFLAAAVSPQSFSSLLVVANMSDCFDEYADVERVADLVASRMAAFAPAPRVHALSGLDEYCRVRGLARPNPALADQLALNFDEFRAVLQREVVLQKDAIRTSRLLTTAHRLVDDVDGRVRLMTKLLEADDARLDELENQASLTNAAVRDRVDASRAVVEDVCRTCQVEAKDWLGGFLDRLSDAVAAIGPDVSVETLQKHLQFYVMDKVREASAACLASHGPRVDEALRAEASGFSESLTLADADGSPVDIAVELRDISWTGGDTAMLVFNVVPELEQALGVIGLVARGVAGAFHERGKSKSKSEIVPQLLAAFPDIRAQVMAQTDATYAELARQAVAALTDMLNRQLQQSAEAVAQAKAVRQSEEIKQSDVAGRIESARGLIDRMRSELARYDTV